MTAEDVHHGRHYHPCYYGRTECDTASGKPTVYGKDAIVQCERGALERNQTASVQYYFHVHVAVLGYNVRPGVLHYYHVPAPPHGHHGPVDGAEGDDEGRVDVRYYTIGANQLTYQGGEGELIVPPKSQTRDPFRQVSE